MLPLMNGWPLKSTGRSAKEEAMPETEMTRIAKMSEPERSLINILSPQERKDTLVKAAQIKARSADRKLMRDYLDRVRSGEVAYQIIDPDSGRPYPTNGRMTSFRNEQEQMEDVGRVPGHEGLHVLRRPNGLLFITGGFNLREEGEAWEDWPGDL